MNKGIFITFEGGEGTGKTTQINLLKDFLKNEGHKVYVTREPGGLEICEEIREVLLKVRKKNSAEINKYSELFLYVASRAHFFEHIIKPNLEDGFVVICDRSFDSTKAYQGYARGLDLELIDYLNKIATLGVLPTLTILLDIDPVVGIERAKGRALLNRLDAEPLDFHKRVREGYKKIAEEEKRIVVVDAHRDIDAIQKDIREVIKDKIFVNI